MEEIEFGKLVARMDHMEESNKTILKMVQNDHSNWAINNQMMNEILKNQTSIQVDLTELIKDVSTIQKTDNARVHTVIGFVAACTLFGGLLVFLFHNILDVLGIPHK